MPEVSCFDPPAQRGDPSMALSALQVAALKAGRLLTDAGDTVLPATSILQTAIPLLRCSAGTMGANGAATWGAATAPDAMEDAYVWFEAGQIAAAQTVAGWYYTVFSSTQAATVYQNTYTTGNPLVPASPTPWISAGPGAFSPDIVNRKTAMNVQVPGGALGANGRIVCNVGLVSSNSANNKENLLLVGASSDLANAGSTISGRNLTTNPVLGYINTFQNAGRPNRQRTQDNVSGEAAGAGGALNKLTIDTTQAFYIGTSLKLAATTDWVMAWRCNFDQFPRA